MVLFGKQKKLNPGSLLRALGDDSLLRIIGDRGSGKTTYQIYVIL